MGRHRTTHRVIGTLTQRQSAACLHPDCSTRVPWKAARGRPSLFCGQAHRDRYRSDRERLVEAVRTAEAAALTSPLREHLARLRWLLARYPDLSRD